MQKNILWTGREYYSLENCIADISHTGTKAKSIIVGMYARKLYTVEYFIATNQHGATTQVSIKRHVDNGSSELSLTSDGNGCWKNNEGQLIPDFDGCMDPDISLTPFTNTLAINRLKLKHDEIQQIKVVYFDILNHQVTPALQNYRRLTKDTVHFETAEKDFEVIIQIDEHGLVIDYPGLFVRTLATNSDYTLP
jgi:uncharacterized protein